MRNVARFAAVVVTMMSLGMLAGGGGAALAGSEEPLPPGYYFCHLNGQSGKYNMPDASSAGVVFGHIGHQNNGDIIPPFTYQGQPVSQNWDEEGQAIHANGCVVPDPPTNTPVPPTDVPPTDVPPTDVPPTDVPPTDVPPTDVPPTDVPPTATTVPGDPTNTPVPPTATTVPGDPTNTPVPPTATEKAVTVLPTTGSTPSDGAHTTVLIASFIGSLMLLAGAGLVGARARDRR